VKKDTTNPLSIPIGEGIRSILVDCQARGLTRKTILFYRDNLENFRKFTQRKVETDIEQVTPD